MSATIEPIEVVSWNSDDIDGGEMIHVLNGTDDSLTILLCTLFLT